MPQSSKYVTVVHNHNDNRSPSVGSWASQTTANYASQSSYSTESSYRGCYQEETYRDPNARDHTYNVKQRQSKKGDVVVTNHNKRTNPDHYEPSPGYGNADYRKDRHKSK